MSEDNSEVDDTDRTRSKAKKAKKDARYTCEYCKEFSHYFEAEVRKHQKTCKASNRPIIKDHQCPVCDEKFHYNGMRSHLNQFIKENGKRLAKARSPHKDLGLTRHRKLKENLITAFNNAKKSRIAYVPFYPIRWQ